MIPISRRQFAHLITFGAGLAATRVPWPRWSRAVPEAKGDVPAPDSNEPQFALSLRNFQSDVAKAAATNSPLPTHLQQLHQLNVLQGYLIEPDQDIVLFGRRDPSLPMMEIDDLVVALRSAFAVDERYRDAPGCTIDPMPDVPDPWRIQIAHVLGMPDTAPMGARHLAIDYDMKKLGAGLLHKDGIAPTFRLLGSRAIPCADGSGESRSATHRFWFCPQYPMDKPRFLADRTGVAIQHPIRVQVQSEEEFLNNGRRTGGRVAQPEAQEFAESLTHLLQGNANLEYSQLRNDFRIIELGKILAFKEVRAEAFQYLLTEFRMREVQTPRFVTGVRRHEAGEIVCDGKVVADGNRITESRLDIHRYSSEFRGGVSADVMLAAADFGQEHGVLDRVRSLVRKSRVPNVAGWAVSA